MSCRKELSLLEKHDILKKFDALPKCNQRDAASKLGVTQPFLCRILKRRNEIAVDIASNRNLGRKRKREGKAVHVEQALLEWFTKAKQMNIPINRSVLIQKAEDLARKFGDSEFVATDGWLTRWKNRCNIVVKKNDENKQNLNKKSANTWLSVFLPSILSKYTPHQIYSTSETFLYYRALPDHVTIFKNDSDLAGEKVRDHVTVLLTCNITGTIKKKPLVIGRTQNPRCFEGIKSLPVTYEATKDAQMTSNIFTTFLLEWDKTLKDEKIVLILDSCATHPNPKLHNIKLLFLSPLVLLTQPLNLRIVKSFKTFYRKCVQTNFIHCTDEGESTASQISCRISILDAIHMIANAWNNVTQMYIFNSFKKAGIFNPESDMAATDQDNEKMSDDSFSETYSEWIKIDDNLHAIPEKTDDEIIEKITGISEVLAYQEEEEEESKKGKAINPPTKHETREALRVIRRTLELKGASFENYEIFYKLEKNIHELMQNNYKQMTMDMYYKKVTKNKSM